MAGRRPDVLDADGERRRRHQERAAPGRVPSTSAL